mgnify:CR=1 FL=1
MRMCERDYGITRREWRVLSSLADVEGVLSSELAVRATLDRARTSRAITSLTDKGLLRREPKPSDRREVHVFLTERGRAVYAEVFPRIAAIQRVRGGVTKKIWKKDFRRLMNRRFLK